MQGHPGSKGDIVIGNDVWIGARATILSGVTIGDGAVVGAGSLVVSDVPAYAISAGNPCRTTRLRFSPDTIARLLEVRWWDWPRPELVAALPFLLSGDHDAFFDFVSRRGGTPPSQR